MAFVMFLVFRRLLRCFRYARLSAHIRLLLHLSRFGGLSKENIEVGLNGDVYIRGTKVDVNANYPSRHFLLEGIGLCTDLIQRSDSSLSINCSNEIVLHVRGVFLVLSNWQELYIAHEVFYHGCYNIHSTKPFILLDVGYNVGMASLFFASHQNCLAVEGYEPFPATYNAGLRNLSLNQHLKEKINLNNFGLSADDKTLTIDYCEELKGSVGIHGVSRFAANSFSPLKTSRVSIHVKCAALEFQRFANSTKDFNLICKLDCEGSEYEIIASLAKEHLLNLMDIFVIEWHEKGPSDIVFMLKTAGFTVLSLDGNAVNHGMIYAWKD